MSTKHCNVCIACSKNKIPAQNLRARHVRVRDLSILQQHISQQTPLVSRGDTGHTRKSDRSMRKHPMQIGTVLQRMVATNRQFNSSKADAEEHLHALIVSLCTH